MKFVLIHINNFGNFSNYAHCSNSIPDYLWNSILQIKRWGNNDILLISDKNEWNNIKSKMNDFGINKISFLPYNNYINNIQARGSMFFSFVTYYRLVILYEAMKEHNLQNVFHLEYDNLIYFNEHELNIDNLKDKICFSVVGNDIGSAGVMYVDNNNCFQNFVIKMNAIYNEFSGEMKALFDLRNDNNVSLFPILEDDINYNKFKVLFDGASWGQFVGGTPNGHSVGFSSDKHYVGQRLIRNEYSVQFDQLNGLKIPYAIKNDNKYRLMNLHIHSKNLKEYMS